MVDYVSLANTANRLIDENGRTISILTRSDTLPDSAKPWEPSALQNPVSAKGVFLDYTKSEIATGIVEQSDQRLLVAAKNLTGDINTAQQVIDNSQTWEVINVREIKPADIIIYYEIQCRH